jgi:MOSC domain-containing protein YiiM
MAVIGSLNVGRLRTISTKAGSTGIDKVPTLEAVLVSAPGPDGLGRGGLAGDVICDLGNHGGDDKALYAFAREDLDWWEAELGTPLRSGMFGENLTTVGIDVTEALIGETWRLGDRVLVQVTCPRVPCSTFAAWIAKEGWLKAFTRRARPGAYLRVLAEGAVSSGDELLVESRPAHPVSVGTAFRALTLEPELCPVLLEASEYLSEEIITRAKRRDVFVL